MCIKNCRTELYTSSHVIDVYVNTAQWFIVLNSKFKQDELQHFDILCAVGSL